MNHQGNQERTLRRSTRRSRGAIASSEVTEGNNENTTEGQPVQKQLEDQDIYQDYECAICLDVLSNPYIVPECCHRFCCECIHKSIEAGNKECPTCRVHIVSKRSLRRDELFGKLLDRLLKVESEVKAMKLKEKTSTSVPMENEETDGEEHEHSPNEQEKSKSEPCDEEKKSAKSKKRKGNGDETHGQAVKKSKSNIPFEHRLKDLQKFKEMYGHCNVPRKYEDDLSLGNWVGRMRYTYKQIQLGKKPQHCLTQARIEKLEDIGFCWKFVNQSFQKNITKLQQFKEKFGHCDVPQRYKDDPSLGNWVAEKDRKAGGNWISMEFEKLFV